MDRAPAHSGSLAGPHTDIAEKIVSNPVYKLLAGLVAGLCGLLAMVALAYISLKISTIDARLDSQDSANRAQDIEIRSLREWQIAHKAKDDTSALYTEFLKNSTAQGEEFLNLLRAIKNRLPDKAKD